MANYSQNVPVAPSYLEKHRSSVKEKHNISSEHSEKKLYALFDNFDNCRYRSFIEMDLKTRVNVIYTEL